MAAGLPGLDDEHAKERRWCDGAGGGVGGAPLEQGESKRRCSLPGYSRRAEAGDYPGARGWRLR